MYMHYLKTVLPFNIQYFKYLFLRSVWENVNEADLSKFCIYLIFLCA